MYFYAYTQRNFVSILQFSKTILTEIGGEKGRGRPAARAVGAAARGFPRQLLHLLQPPARSAALVCG